MSIRDAVALTLVILAASCGVDGADYTSVGVTVRFSTSLGPDQLMISGRSTLTNQPIDPIFAPDRPGAPLTAGKASLVILLPDDLDGENLAIRVDGLKNGDTIGSGADLVIVRRNALSGARVFLGAPADCGDGIVRPLLEQCDDSNTRDGDGCNQACTIEDGFVCVTAPSAGPSLCSRTNKGTDHE